MDNSWIKLHRKFLESPLWVYAVRTHYHVLISFFIYLLVSANWKEAKWYDGKNEINIPAGSLIGSQSQWAESLGVTRTSVRTCLNHLEKMKMITSRTTNKWTQVWIVNWGKYQMNELSSNQQNNQRLNNDYTTTAQRANTIEYIKNVDPSPNSEAVGRRGVNVQEEKETRARGGLRPTEPAFKKGPVDIEALDRWAHGGKTEKEKKWDDYVKKNSKHLGISEEQFIIMVTPPKRRPQ